MHPLRYVGIALVMFVAVSATAVPVTLWEDDGSGQGDGGTFTSGPRSLVSPSNSQVVADPLTTGRGDTVRFQMDGANGSNTEWGSWRMNTSPFKIKTDRVWDPRIQPGSTPFTFTADILVPAGTTMAGTDKITLVIRFLSDGGAFGDRVEMSSTSYQVGDAGGWNAASVSGTVPAVDGLGDPIAEIELLIAVTDHDPTAGTGDYGYIDNVHFEVDVITAPILPPHPVTAQPTSFDGDGNSIPDLWEALYNAKGLDPAGDEDNDGSPNWKEAEDGTDPFDPNSHTRLTLEDQSASLFRLSWPALPLRTSSLEGVDDLVGAPGWSEEPLTPSQTGDVYEVTFAPPALPRYYRVRTTELDLDLDGLPDWLEPFFGFGHAPGDDESVGLDRSYDTDGDTVPDVTLAGDLAMFNEIYLHTSPSNQPTRSQTARFLIQSTFGPTFADIDYTQQIGFAAWIDEQLAMPKTYTSPYILAIKDDFDTGANDPALAGYAANTFVFGVNFMTPWARSAIAAPDQLRQRVAFALSQILVASRGAAMLANQPQAIAHYYDQFVDEAFGNYEDLLFKVSLHPVMGHYLSHLGNQKADPAKLRFPDENYAREIMQLFSIGLWELNLDGTRVLDGMGEPIPTYGNPEITEMARVFTGVNYASGNFGGGWRDDGFYMTTPMKVFASEHDFEAKTLLNGYMIPARAATDAHALLDVTDAVNHLFLHNNTPPFICRQLIQFLVTSNPSTGYVQRVASVFVDNGSGVRGDMGAVVKAILLDEEARNPLQHLATPSFGELREPTIRTMHLARVMKLGRFDDLMWWDWGTYRGDSLQEPMHSPSVFNFFRPDFRLHGQLAENELDSPAFGITDSYSVISFPNRLWTYAKNGFKQNGYDFPPDWSDLTANANNIPALLDDVSLLFCAGTMGATTRDILTEVLQSTGNLTQRARLAAYLALMSPEGSCLK